MIQMNLSTKQKQTYGHREQTYGCQGVGGRDGLGVWGLEMQTSIHRMNKQQGPAVQHGERVQCPVTSHNGEEYIYLYIYMYN